MRDLIFTCFPKSSDDMPQDFSSYHSAVAYGDATFGYGNYEVFRAC